MALARSEIRTLMFTTSGNRKIAFVSYTEVSGLLR